MRQFLPWVLGCVLLAVLLVLGVNSWLHQRLPESAYRPGTQAVVPASAPPISNEKACSLVQDAYRIGIFKERRGAANHVYVSALFYQMTADEKAGCLASLALCVGSDMAVAHDMFTGKKVASYMHGLGFRME